MKSISNLFLMTIGTAIVTTVVSLSSHAMDDLFTVLDTDENGMISKQEAQAHEKLSKLFDQLDIDRDGSLSRQEFNALNPE